MTYDSPLELAAVVGIDWADEHHDVALQVTATGAREELRLPHTPEALQRWLGQLEERFGGQRIGVAVETSRGPLVHALLEAPFIVLYPVNPRSLRRFREAFSPSGAKDDAPDARLLLELVLKHREQLRPWQPEEPVIRLLGRLVEQRRTAVGLRTKLIQQLQAVLKEYFPQALDWAGTDLASPMASHFLQRWPTLAKLQRARPTTVQRFYTSHGCRRRDRIEACLSAIATATPLTRDPAILESGALYVQLLTTQLLALAPSIAKLDEAIAEQFDQHPDAAIFASLPGAGAALAPRLLVALGTDRTSFPTAADVQKHTGIAPITIRSGRQCLVHRRWATSVFLRQTLHEFAQHSIKHTPWARAYYAQQRSRGCTHHTAVRALAFKWIRIIWRCWQDHTPYDDARYIRALHLRHSPVSASLPISHVADAAA
ncbi:MAG TPA: IS110 family transposase [Gemmatimonadaceae bacterium]|nr:IS110 family transposase [Gemmatimonadaceae bacterium]